jgi:hypothetical protein
VNLINESEVNIFEPTLDTYDMDGDGEEVEDGDDKDDFEEIEEEVFDSSKSLTKKRVVNYTENKTFALCRHGRKCPSMR